MFHHKFTTKSYCCHKFDHWVYLRAGADAALRIPGSYIFWRATLCPVQPRASPQFCPTRLGSGAAARYSDIMVGGFKLFLTNTKVIQDNRFEYINTIQIHILHMCMSRIQMVKSTLAIKLENFLFPMSIFIKGFFWNKIIIDK